MFKGESSTGWRRFLEIDLLASIRGWLMVHSVCRLDSQLRKTNVPSFSYRGSDEFVDTVKQIVQLFSNGLTNGMLPDAGSWLGTMQDAYNHDHMEEILDDFKVCMYVTTCRLPDELADATRFLYFIFGFFLPRAKYTQRGLLKNGILGGAEVLVQ